MLLGALAFLFTRPPVTTPGAGSPEGQFTQGLLQHHAQAITRSRMLCERSRDRRVRSLALDIDLAQQKEIRRMQGWLHLWGQGEGPPMPPEHARTMGMAGMASPAELAGLRTLPARAAELSFLRLMVGDSSALMPTSIP